MHFCGNPLHDLPLYLVTVLPFLSIIIAWVRSVVSRVSLRGRRSAQSDTKE